MSVASGTTSERLKTWSIEIRRSAEGLREAGLDEEIVNGNLELSELLATAAKETKERERLIAAEVRKARIEAMEECYELACGWGHDYLVGQMRMRIAAERAKEAT